MKRKEPLPETLRAAARKLRRGQTDAEHLMWLLLRDRRLAGVKFRRQHPVRVHGEHYILDFYAHGPGLAIELDGGQHLEQDEADRERTAALARQGITVLRFWNNDVLTNTESVLEVIWDALTPNPSPGGRGA